MAPPTIKEARKLVPWERAYLEELTGHSYEAVVRGNPEDGILGLVNQFGVDLIGAEIAPRLPEDGESSATERFSGFQLISYGFDFEGSGRSFASFPAVFLFALHDASRSDEGVREIEVIYRNELDEVKQERLNGFMDIYETLTPTIREKIRAVDFRRVYDDGSYANAAIGILRIGGEDVWFRHHAYHEIAHLHTASIEENDPEFIARWEGLETDVCEGEDLRDEYGVHCEGYIKQWEPFVEEGLVSWYAGTNYSEEISEIFAFSYTTPGYVTWLAGKSPKLREKISMLHEAEYIDDVRYISLTQYEKQEEFEREWEMLSPCNEPGLLKCISHSLSQWLDLPMKKDEAIEAGYIDNAARQGTIADILALSGAIDSEPDAVREAMKESPIIRKKVDLLYKYEHISDEKYAYLISSEETPSFAKLYRELPGSGDPQEDAFAESATCYLDPATSTSSS